MMQPTITAAVIALNEADNLPSLIDRLAFADEIVIVDGGSTDETVSIARSAGCTVLERRFDAFAAQRNAAIDAASSDWVFAIDADERPTQSLIREIQLAMQSGRCSAYRVSVRSRILGRAIRRSGTQDDRPVRLFRRGTARWIGDVHERLLTAGRVGRLKNWLEHDTLPDLQAFLAKIDRYTSLEASARISSGQRPRALDAWVAPPREILRRLIWKQGVLDGPAGWAFCLLSGYSEWILADKHRLAWQQRQITQRRVA